MSFDVSGNKTCTTDRFIAHSAHSGKTARNGSRRPRVGTENVAYLASYVSCLSSQVPSNMFRQSALASMNVERHDSLQSFCARNRDTHDSSTTPAHSPCLRRKVRSTSAQQVASQVAGAVSRTFVHRSVHDGASAQCGKSVAKDRKLRNLSRRVGASARKASKVELKRWCARAQSSAAAQRTAPTVKRNDNKNKRVNMVNVKEKKEIALQRSINIATEAFRIQSFDPRGFDLSGLSRRQQMYLAGNAIDQCVLKALFKSLL